MNRTTNNSSKPRMFKKRRGQNFLVDKNILKKIASAALLTKKDTVLEIGAGTGLLTELLAERAGHVIAVEIEKNFQETLKQKFLDVSHVRIVEGDFLKIPLEKILEKGKNERENLCVVANIPYSITAPILNKLLGNNNIFNFIILTVQKEVADRICASPRTKAYGSLTLFVNFYCTAEKLFNISPSCFFPKPDVMSTCVKLEVKIARCVSVPDEKFFFRVVSRAFQQRRKTLRNALLSLPTDKDSVARALKQCGLSQKARAEELTLQQFADLSGTLYPYPCKNAAMARWVTGE